MSLTLPGGRRVEVVVFDPDTCKGEVREGIVGADGVCVVGGVRLTWWSAATIAEREALAVRAKLWNQQVAAREGGRER